MYDYSETITEFEENDIRLCGAIDQRLTDRRNANRNRLINRLGDYIPDVRISDSSFKVQGSRAHGTTIQTKFTDEEYDIDDGLLLKAEDLVDEQGDEMGADDVKDAVRRALKDKRFKRQPRIKGNCVRVFYAEEDKDKHHIDFPVYRIREDGDTQIRELAGIDGWVASDPTQVYNFFEDEVRQRNKNDPDKGSQMRILNRLLKRFCRSRLAKENGEWDMPNGMKLLMLIAETQADFSNRIDEAFYNLLEKLKSRLDGDKTIKNLAHPEQPFLTKTFCDGNVEELYARIEEALEKLRILFEDRCTEKMARDAWDWLFRSSGRFEEIDKKRIEKKAKVEALSSRAKQVIQGTACVNALGQVGAFGTPYTPTKFYGDA